MPRYFLELAYKGTNYSGFQVQKNANTIQAETEKALTTLYQTQFSLTASSRTDAGVHALQNFFHFDTDVRVNEKHLYNLNALLPPDVAAKNIFEVNETAHCRFDAVSRTYQYHIYQAKNPFLKETAYYYPYPLNAELLNQMANAICGFTDFTSFSKRKTQVKTFLCSVKNSIWHWHDEQLIYTVTANRFLRGMVRGLVGTMLNVAKNKQNTELFKAIIEACDCRRADFSAPAHGLFLANVEFRHGIL